VQARNAHEMGDTGGAEDVPVGALDVFDLLSHSPGEIVLR
jgi:hypothetical protein